ncbi:hypothetical protein SMIF22_00810 [Streptococcus mitis]
MEENVKKYESFQSDFHKNFDKTNKIPNKNVTKI